MGITFLIISIYIYWDLPNDIILNVIDDAEAALGDRRRKNEEFVCDEYNEVRTTTDLRQFRKTGDLLDISATISLRNRSKAN